MKMNESMEVLSDLVRMDVSAKGRDEALRYMTGLMEEHGFIDPLYSDKVIEREVNFPTGLKFESISISIPHGDSQYVKTSSIAVGRCREKMPFYSMEDPNTIIEVDFIVLLAMKEPETSVVVLNKLMKMFTNKFTCDRLLKETSPDTVCEMFNGYLRE